VLITRSIFTLDSLVLTTAFVLVSCSPALNATPEKVISAHHANTTVLVAIVLVLNEVLRSPILTR
jgi:hypothetical protein